MQNRASYRRLQWKRSLIIYHRKLNVSFIKRCAQCNNHRRARVDNMWRRQNAPNGNSFDDWPNCVEVIAIGVRNHNRIDSKSSARPNLICDTTGQRIRTTHASGVIEQCLAMGQLNQHTRTMSHGKKCDPQVCIAPEQQLLPSQLQEPQDKPTQEQSECNRWSRPCAWIC